MLKKNAHTVKKKRPCGCVRECEGARTFGNVGVALCGCVCAGQLFLNVFFFRKKYVFLTNLIFLKFFFFEKNVFGFEFFVFCF